jgi:hypothetical protein
MRDKERELQLFVIQSGVIGAIIGLVLVTLIHRWFNGDLAWLISVVVFIGCYYGGERLGYRVFRALN